MTYIIAHRGFSGKYPENTVLAFEKAVEAGCHGIELDVQLTKDGVPVIIHDESLRRTAGESGNIWDYTLNEIKKLDVSGKQHDIFGKLEIPTLQEYFDHMNSETVFTNIELKNSNHSYPGIEEKVLRIVYDMNQQRNVLLSSFNHYSMKYVKQIAPEIKCAINEQSRIVDMVQYAERLKMDYIHPSYQTVTYEYLSDIRSHELGINVWTVNQEDDMRTLLQLGVDGIITNYPDRLQVLIGK